MNPPARALRLGRLLAVLAVWAGVLGYVIPAAFSARPGASATTAAVASQPPGGPHVRRGLHVERHRPSDRPASAMVRVIQAAPRPRWVTVTVAGQAMSHDQAFASVTPYRAVRPGTWTVHAVSASEQATARVTLAAGSSNTLVVLDSHDHLAIRAEQDSAGVSAPARAGGLGGGLGQNVKAPARAAGLGGGVGGGSRPGWSRVVWLAPTATAVLLGLAWLARLRQFRWARRVAGRIR
jgi:hypothetical protein